MTWHTKWKGPKRNKYGAKKVVRHGIKFDSKIEADRYTFLLGKQAEGEISDLEPHHKFWLTVNGRDVKIKSKGYPNGRRCSWTSDASYVRDGEVVYEDTKGMDTNRSRLKRAIVEAIYDIEIKIVKKPTEF